MSPGEIETAFHALCDVASAETMRWFRKHPEIDNKAQGGFDPVTLADRNAERAIRAWLTKNYPGHGISGEEEPPTNRDAEFCWIVDPIDGTRSYISGLPAWGTLIGLTQNRSPIAGVMHQPFTDEKFFTTGRGSFLEHRGKRNSLKTSGVNKLSSATVMSTAPELYHEGVAAAWERICKSARLVRYGFDCYAFCMVAAGQVDLVIEVGMKTHDIAALIPIIEQAGGVVATWEGGPAVVGGNIVAAANDGLLAEALDFLGQQAEKTQ